MKRSRRSDAGDVSTAIARATVADETPGWTDSAGDLLKGTDIVEYSGDFAATVFLEHFAEQAPASVQH